MATAAPAVERTGARGVGRTGAPGAAVLMETQLQTAGAATGRAPGGAIKEASRHQRGGSQERTPTRRRSSS
eukprot:11205704-Lingulodinium_polyedra.AAC.1